MPNHKRDFYSKIRNDLVGIVDEFEPMLPKGSLGQVRHYIRHDEYELGFEGLCLELIRHGATVNKKTRETILNLAGNLDSFSDPVFDADLQKKLQDYLAKSGIE